MKLPEDFIWWSAIKGLIWLSLWYYGLPLTYADQSYIVIDWAEPYIIKNIQLCLYCLIDMSEIVSVRILHQVLHLWMIWMILYNQRQLLIIRCQILNLSLKYNKWDLFHLIIYNSIRNFVFELKCNVWIILVILFKIFMLSINFW